MMRVITRRCFPTLFAAAAATLGAGCAPLLISTSVDRGVDLSAYRTYGWSSQAAAATGDPRLDGNPFFHGYLAASIDKRLIATGLVRQGGEPDLLVRYFAGVAQQVSASDAELPDDRGLPCRDCRLAVNDTGTIVVDLVDSRTRALVWRGWVKGDVDGVIDDQGMMEQRIDRGVARIFEHVGRR